jgi:hypothetical protein
MVAAARIHGSRANVTARPPRTCRRRQAGGAEQLDGPGAGHPPWFAVPQVLPTLVSQLYTELYTANLDLYTLHGQP